MINDDMLCCPQTCPQMCRWIVVWLYILQACTGGLLCSKTQYKCAIIFPNATVHSSICTYRNMRSYAALRQCSRSTIIQSINQSIISRPPTTRWLYFRFLHPFRCGSKFSLGCRHTLFLLQRVVPPRHITNRHMILIIMPRGGAWPLERGKRSRLDMTIWLLYR